MRQDATIHDYRRQSWEIPNELKGINLMKIPAYFTSDLTSYSFIYARTLEQIMNLVDDILCLDEKEKKNIDFKFISENIDSKRNEKVNYKLFMIGDYLFKKANEYISD